MAWSSHIHYIQTYNDPHTMAQNNHLHSKMEEGENRKKRARENDQNEAVKHHTMKALGPWL